MLDLDTPEGRYAARAYAVFVLPLGEEGLELYRRIMEQVGVEG